MRIRDEKKKTAITQAVYDIVRTEGLSNLSIGKIAKAAGVSPATVYIYYVDKTDMLSKIYLEVKVIMDTGLAEQLIPSMDVKTKVATAIRHFAERALENPLEANFMMAVQANPDAVSAEALATADNLAQPVKDLFVEAIASKTLRSEDPAINVAFFAGPMSYYLQQQAMLGVPVTGADIEIVINNSIRAMFVD